eukprot:jgi/Mesvir1/803/Mv17396-RA.1
MTSATGPRRRVGAGHSERPNIEDTPNPEHPRAKGMSAGVMGAGTLILAAIAAALMWPSGHVDKTPRIISPLYPNKKLTALPQFGGAHEEDLLWGTYRPQLYFGMRTRRPQSLLAGLMWFDPQNTQEGLQLRHSCEQGDRLSQYGWLRHDGRSYGRQDLFDRDYILTTTFVKRLRQPDTRSKRESASPLPGYGGDWAVRISARRAPGFPSDAPRTISLLFYLADEAGASMTVHRPIGHDSASTSSRHARKGRKEGGHLGTGGALVSGTDATLGNAWALHVADAGMHSVSYFAAHTPHMHNLTELVSDHLVSQARRRGQLALGGSAPQGAQGPNVIVYQITAALPVTLDVTFASRSLVELSCSPDTGNKESSGSVESAASIGGGSSGLGGSHSQPGADKSGVDDRVVINAPDSNAGDEGGQKRAGAGHPDTPKLHDSQVPVPPVPLELSGAGLGALFEAREAAFDARFDATFPVGEGGGAVAGVSSAGGMLRGALSNLLGGMGYFYGSSLVRDTEGVPAGQQAPILHYWPAPLFTATPSRSFFPRGFLWDEGFHQLLVGRWDPALRRDVLAHWLDLMNVNGWIPREQILGAEAARKVPAEFVVQSSGHANPPTLFLPLMAMAERVMSAERATSSRSNKASSDKEDGQATQKNAVDGNGDAPADVAVERLGAGGDVDKDLEFLRAAFPRLEVWYRWFNTTQRGADPRGFMWRGRDPSSGDGRELNAKTLTSGLDDYPRASHPSPQELHVDLWCWMALASRCMAAIGRLVGAPSRQLAAYEADAAHLADNRALEAVHFDAKRGGFFDFGNHTERVALRRKMLPPEREGQPPRTSVVREVTGRPKMRHVPHVGYVTLFPLLMKLLDPQSAPLGQVLDLLGDERQLWSRDAGLRSLSLNSSLYMARNTEHDPPYWRGPVWINLNYLALGALHHYRQVAGPHAARAGELYASLRQAVLGNIQECYARTHYLWEQYGDKTRAEGKGSHPFTGWTALVVLIAADMY